MGGFAWSRPSWSTTMRWSGAGWSICWRRIRNWRSSASRVRRRGHGQNSGRASRCRRPRRTPTGRQRNRVVPRPVVRPARSALPDVDVVRLGRGDARCDPRRGPAGSSSRTSRGWNSRRRWLITLKPLCGKRSATRFGMRGGRAGLGTKVLDVREIRPAVSRRSSARYRRGCRAR